MQRVFLFFLFSVCFQFPYHAGNAPDVSGRPIVGPQQDLQRAILTGLDLVTEVFVLVQGEQSHPQLNQTKRLMLTAIQRLFTDHPAGAAQVGNLHRHLLQILQIHLLLL